MKQTTHYSRIEKIVYEFSEADIEEALIGYTKLGPPKSGRRIELELVDSYDDKKGYAILTVIFEKPDDK